MSSRNPWNIHKKRHVCAIFDVDGSQLFLEILRNYLRHDSL